MRPAARTVRAASPWCACAGTPKAGCGAPRRGHPSVLAAGLSALSVGYRRGSPSAAWRMTGAALHGAPALSGGLARRPDPGRQRQDPARQLATLTLVALGAAPAVVGRGYGRSTRGVHVVADRQGVRLGARSAGDEPLLPGRAPARRPRGGRATNHFEAGRHAVETISTCVILLDDGFQIAPCRSIESWWSAPARPGRRPPVRARPPARAALRAPARAAGDRHQSARGRGRGGSDAHAAAARFARARRLCALRARRGAPRRRRARACRSRSWPAAGCSPSADSPPRAPSWRPRRAWASRSRASVEFGDHHWYSGGRSRGAGASGGDGGRRGLRQPPRRFDAPPRLPPRTPAPLDPLGTDSPRDQSGRVGERRSVRSPRRREP